MSEQAEGFFATVKRGAQTGVLLGPYGTKGEADAMVPEARRLAYRVDPRTHFDLFGVTWIRMPPGVALPQAKLNHLIGTEDESRIQAYHHIA